MEIINEHQLSVDIPLKLKSGKTLNSYDLVYETYGQLNDNKDNAVLICHALSGNHHVAGYHEGDDKPGWWDNMVGSGKPINTNKLFVVCVNNIGGCHGSTGPTSINKETGTNYGFGFPVITVQDWVNSQKVLMDNIGIKKWRYVVGGSLGGMQAFQWALDYPDYIDNAIIIAAAPKLTAQNIAFNEVARQAIMNDPDWCGGNYLSEDKIPKRGLALARMLGHITYLSDKSMAEKFGRDLKQEKIGFNFDVEFQIESYLRYQGSVFVDRFDANSYLYITRAMDYFDLVKQFNGNLSNAFKNTKAKFFVMSFTSDWLYPTQENKDIVIALNAIGADVGFVEIKSDKGHDSFLLDVPDFLKALKNFLDKSYSE